MRHDRQSWKKKFQCFKNKESFFIKLYFFCRISKTCLPVTMNQKAWKGPNWPITLVMWSLSITGFASISILWSVKSNSRDENCRQNTSFWVKHRRNVNEGDKWTWSFVVGTSRFRHLQTLSRKTCYQIALMDTRKQIHFWEDIQCFKSKHSFQSMERSKSSILNFWWVLKFLHWPISYLTNMINIKFWIVMFRC